MARAAAVPGSDGRGVGYTRRGLSCGYRESCGTTLSCRTRNAYTRPCDVRRRSIWQNCGRRDCRCIGVGTTHGRLCVSSRVQCSAKQGRRRQMYRWRRQGIFWQQVQACARQGIRTKAGAAASIDDEVAALAKERESALQTLLAAEEDCRAREARREARAEADAITELGKRQRRVRKQEEEQRKRTAEWPEEAED